MQPRRRDEPPEHYCTAERGPRRRIGGRIPSYPEPIDDPMTVLDLLVQSWGDNTVRQIERWPHFPTHVHVEHCSDFSYLITDEVADQLLAHGWAAGVPKWGYTEMRELRATEFGERVLWERRSRLDGIKFPRATRWFGGF